MLMLNMNLDAAWRSNGRTCANATQGKIGRNAGSSPMARDAPCWPGKNKTPEDRDLPGFRRQGRLSLAETEGFEPSIQVLARMLP
ncbi:hypothetical protein [Cupriavidus sp. H39]|uniref:hypothetical protein n=1 Tax=Cupriavidus sp. H39 TaxID=3401635 RepID=UPI003D064E7E